MVLLSLGEPRKTLAVVLLSLGEPEETLAVVLLSLGEPVEHPGIVLVLRFRAERTQTKGTSTVLGCASCSYCSSSPALPEYND